MARATRDNSARARRRIGRIGLDRLRSPFIDHPVGRCLAAPNICSGNWNQGDKPSGGPVQIPTPRHRHKFTCIAAYRVRKAAARAHPADRRTWGVPLSSTSTSLTVTSVAKTNKLASPEKKPVPTAVAAPARVSAALELDTQSVLKFRRIEAFRV